MFRKKKQVQSPYPKQQYVDVPNQPMNYRSPQPDQYQDQKYQPPAGAAYSYTSSSGYSQQVPSAPPIYGEPPPPYSQFPDHQQPAHSPPGQYHSPYPQHSYQPQYPSHSQGAHYPSSSAPYPTNYSYPAQPSPYPTQPVPHTVVAVGGFDAGARFNAGAAPVVPPAPPGVVPNGAQMAASQGHNVVATQRNTNWFTGGTGGGPIF